MLDRETVLTVLTIAFVAVAALIIIYFLSLVGGPQNWL